MNYFEYQPKLNNNPSRPLTAHGNQMYEDAQIRLRLGYEQDHPTQVPVAAPQPARKGVLALLSALLNPARG